MLWLVHRAARSIDRTPWASYSVRHDACLTVRMAVHSSQSEGASYRELDYGRILNRILPQDIRVTSWTHVPPDFSARCPAPRRAPMSRTDDNAGRDGTGPADSARIRMTRCEAAVPRAGTGAGLVCRVGHGCYEATCSFASAR